MTENIDLKLNVTGHIRVSGNLNGVSIDNLSIYGLQNFNESKDSVQFEIKNVYDKFSIRYFYLCNCAEYGKFAFSLYDSAYGKFNYKMGDSTATISVGERNYVIPAEIEKY